MARDVYMTDYYRKDNRALLPVRWMAPESLMDGIFTTMSDIWSYGVVLWEMVTLAEQPYQGLGNEEVLRYVTEGRTMNAPIGCPVDLYDLMLKCWAFSPKKRPTFMFLIECLAPHLNEKFQQVSFFFQEMAKEEAEAEAEMAATARSSPSDAEGDRYGGGDNQAENYLNCDSSSLRARKSKAENSSASGSFKSRNVSSEDEDCAYLESDPARISPTPSTPSTSSRKAQKAESSRHSQSYIKPVITSDLSESDNDFENETFDQGAVVQRDAQYMLSPKDARSSSERLKLLPESSGSQKPKVGSLVLPSPLTGNLDKDEYTIMSPPASSSRSQFSPSYLFPTSSLQSPVWQGKPTLNAEDPKYKGNSPLPKNGGIREAIWPNTLPTLASPGQEGKLTGKLAVSPMESIKSVSMSSPTSEGSKDSNSSAGSSHRFHPATANGNGPFHHQQTAFC
ncbi:hypothetical protein Btru_071969 [Bulinus truncatus]|nr:hypothetical protein Btru_071969 [Bulinus truncatus]